MDLKDRITTYIQNHHPIPYSKLLRVAQSKGYTEMEVLTVLDAVHKNKQITTKTRKDEIWYDITIAPPAPKPQTHLTWLRNNYPPMNSTNDGSGIDVGDLSWMFLKTKEERDAFKAEMSGKPLYMKKKYA